jgi:hypothetical protein
MLTVVERQFEGAGKTYRMGDVVDASQFPNRVALESSGYLRPMTLGDLIRVGGTLQLPEEQLTSLNVYDLPEMPEASPPPDSSQRDQEPPFDAGDHAPGVADATLQGATIGDGQGATDTAGTHAPDAPSGEAPPDPPPATDDGLGPASSPASPERTGEQGEASTGEGGDVPSESLPTGAEQDGSGVTAGTSASDAGAAGPMELTGASSPDAGQAPAPATSPTSRRTARTQRA